MNFNYFEVHKNNGAVFERHFRSHKNRLVETSFIDFVCFFSFFFSWCVRGCFRQRPTQIREDDEEEEKKKEETVTFCVAFAS